MYEDSHVISNLMKITYSNGIQFIGVCGYGFKSRVDRECVQFVIKDCKVGKILYF